MAQIIKHRRGGVGSVKSTASRNAELIVSSGSVNDLNGPFVYIGTPDPNLEGVAGAYTPISKIYTGTNKPTIAAGTYGSTLDGIPFYSTNDQTLYILGNEGSGGSTNMDLTGNLEGRSIDKITLQSINGDIQVTGSVKVTGAISASGAITASNLSLSGDANISGNINLGGNIFIGNQTTDLIVFGGEVSSSIYPTVSNAFDLGSPTLNWKDLHVSGTAYINQAKISNMEINGVIVFEDLIVSGNAFLGDSTTDKVNVTGSLNISGSQTLTGSLKVLGNTTLTGNLSSTNFAATDTNVTINANYSPNVVQVQTYNGANFVVNTNSQGEVDITSPQIKLVGTLSQSGNIVQSGSLLISGGAVITDNVFISGSTYLGDNGADSVNITGSVNILGSTTQTGSILLKGTAVITDNLFISGTTNLGNEAGDRLTVTGSINVLGSTTQTGSIYLQGSQIIETNLTVSGTTNLGNEASDSTNVTGSLNVSGSQTLTGSFKLHDVATDFNIVGNIFGQTSLQSTSGALILTPGYGGVNINGTNPDLQVNGDVTIQGGTIDVTNAATNIAVKDNTSNALTINQGSDNYLTITTTDNAELITIGNSITSINEVVEDNVANAYVVKEGSNPYITVDTTNGVEKIKLQTAGNVEVSGITTIQNTTQNTTWNDGALIVSGGVGIGKNLYVSGSTTIVGNLTVLGSSSVVNISSSTVNIDDNIIRVNAFAPFLRYAGIEMMDSGSTTVSASFLWDSTNDYFLIASASGETGRVISTTYSTQGSEIALTPNTLPKATGASAIGDSYLKDDGTSFSYYTDALIVTGSSGQTYIKGKVTLVHGGGTDANSFSSAMLFRNSSNELGYVSTTATTNVLNGILGYREDNGQLEFSSKIDGGYF